jgi:hypothetical protein
MNGHNLHNIVPNGQLSSSRRAKISNYSLFLNHLITLSKNFYFNHSNYFQIYSFKYFLLNIESHLYALSTE